MEGIKVDIEPAHLFRYISQLDPRKEEKVKITNKNKIINNTN